MSDKIIQNIAKEIVSLVRNELNALLKQFFENKIVWLTSKEAADHLKISENNLRAKVSRGQIQAHGRLGKSLRFRRDKLDELLNNPDQGVFND
jgi:excisionase family DNA binding protein